jgi:hypothetical protein
LRGTVRDRSGRTFTGVPPFFARALATSLLALPLAGRAAAPGDPVQAVRRIGPVVVDGRLDEPEWAAAPVFDGFVQRFPLEGAPPAEGTTVRVLFDDRTLFIGVACRDRRPDLVQRPLGRRDSAPYGDSVTLLLDSTRDGRNAYVFSVSAAGVQSDGLQSDDDEYVADWDAVWEGAASATADGWSAELAIPLAALRFQDRGAPIFGFAVKRIVGRTHEEDWSVRIPRNASGHVARLAPLLGLSGLAPSADVEIVPYAAARLTWSPQYDDPLRPRPRLFQPNADLGLDLKASLGRGLVLQGTVNPDFGQVEADQIVLNLSSFETFFPEKRPFFTQGVDLFRPVAPQGRASPQQLFYSRRIGLTTPILAAAKLSGSVNDRLQIGLVEAFVAGEAAGSDQDHPDRSYRFSPSRPLWFGPRSALPQLAPASENFLAAVARWQPDPRASMGATFTSAVLGGPPCTGDESRLDDDHRPARCDALAGNALALDFNLRTLDGEWFLRGQATASQALGGSPERTLPDGIQIRPGDLGAGAHAALGRAGGEPWRFELHWELESPRLDVNAVGYQRTQNEQVGRAILRYVRPGGGGPFLSWSLAGIAETHLTTDGRGLQRGQSLLAGSEFQLRSFDTFGVDAWVNLDHWDVREIDQSGVDAGRVAAPLAVEMPGDLGADFWVVSNPSRPLALEAGAGGGRSLAHRTLPTATYCWFWANAIVRPHPRVETRIGVSYTRNAWPVRYAGDDGAANPADRQFLLADLVAPELSVTLTQQLVLTTHLTLQAYAQLFSSFGRYGGFRTATASGGRIGLGDVGQPVDRPQDLAWWDNPDFRSSRLNLDVVLRWEYRLGSTLYLVYSRSQAELGYPDASRDPSPTFTLRPVGLGSGPTVDTFLVKWSYWWSR